MLRTHLPAAPDGQLNKQCTGLAAGGRDGILDAYLVSVKSYFSTLINLC